MSDHQNLTYFKSAQKLTHRQARWSLYLTRFNINLQHQPGTTMLRADPLSRRPDHEEGVEQDNRSKTMLKPEYFAIRAMQPSHEAPIDDDRLLTRIKEALKDDDVTKGYKELLKKGEREFSKGLEDWNFEDGLLLYRGKVYVPKMDKEESLRHEVLKIHHDLPSARHPGRWKTYEYLSRNYWWPEMTYYVKRYVSACETCQRNKNINKPPYGPLQPNDVPEHPWDIITVDLITQLPKLDKHNAICVVVDRFSKRVHFYSITNEFSAKDLAHLMYERVWTQHGLPSQIIIDRGPQFASKLFQEWCELLSIKSSMSTAYHPQTDGQTERVNQSLEQYLHFYCNYRTNNWSKFLPAAEFAYNNQAHESTKSSPFFIEYGRHPRAGPFVIKSASHPEISDYENARKEAQEQAKAALTLAAERMKWYYNQHIAKVPFKQGDRVMIDTRNWQTTERKLNPHRAGPYTIKEQLGPVTFRLDLPKNISVHPVFHASQLVPFVEDTISKR